LIWKFFTLGALTLFLVVLSWSTNTPLAKARVAPAPIQTPSPSVITETQPAAPLVISALRNVSWDGQYLEVAIDLVNVSNKPIRAYAIKQGIEGQTQTGQVSFITLDATNQPRLRPNQVTTDFDSVYQADDRQQHIVFFIDYVEFSDGSKWGQDSAKSSERSAGQRAAAYVLSKRLLKILNAGNPNDVIAALDKGEANIEPPSRRSYEWKEGFRFGCKTMAQSLKRAQSKGQLDFELRQFAETFRRAQ
jgi:hypothetical protein